MNITKPTLWKDIWEKKGQASLDEVDLQQLIAIDGFDTGAGEFPVDSWLSFVETIRERLNVNEGQKLLEVGCGAGAFMLPMYKKGIEVYGIDYSKNMIQLCTNIMPSGTFELSEAKTIPFESEMFDAVVSNSVFQYFNDIGYSENVVREIARVLKKSGRAGLLDINDTHKKEQYESIRRKKLGNKEYDRLYGSLKQQYYSKMWFVEVTKNCGLKCEIEEQNISGYENSKFRYNVFLEKA